MKTKVQQLSAAFSRIVREQLSPELLAKVIDKNRKWLGHSICHTYAIGGTEMMNRAWKETFDGEPPVLHDDTNYNIWTEAWNLSKLTEFNEIVIIDKDTKAILWTTDDVLKQAEEDDFYVTKEQAEQILSDTIDAHAADIGISWEDFAFNIQNVGVTTLKTGYEKE